MPDRLTSLDFNYWADFWRYTVGVNVIPAITEIKKFHKDLGWKQWQNSPIPEEQHEQWKAQDMFSKGLAVMAGKVWHREDKKDLYLNLIDCDNQKAIDEIICTINGSQLNLEEAAQYTIVEQHPGNPNKAHGYVYSH